MTRSFRSHLTRAALLGSAVLLAPLAMADTPAPAASTTQPSVTPVPAAAPPNQKQTENQTRDEMRARRHADREAFFSARLAALRAGLQLKPEQDALWTPVETAIRDFGKLRASRWAERDARMDDHGKSDVSTEALKTQADRLIARGNAMRSLADATAPLLGSLSTDQKGRLPRLLDGLHPKRVLARAFALDDRRDDRQAWSHEGREHEGWGRGMRHEHWAERGMRERDERGGDDRRAERFDRDDEGHGFERGHHDDHAWDGERAQRDGMRGDGMRDDDDMGRGERPMHHHHDRGDESDRT